jgi:tetratricopeptide (TPR) repeat protein
MRGAWCSGGIELNFPYAHTVTAFSEVTCALKENPDGSASIVISDIERRYRMKWKATFTLYPGKYYVEQSVKLYNRSDTPHRYYWWSIAAVPVNDDCQMIYPAQRVIEHWRTKIYKWPIADGSVEPMLKGKNISFHKNIPHSVCWSAYLPTDDYFCYYDHRINKGIAHYGDRYILEGTKFWDFGNYPAGHYAASVVLTDNDGPYNEIDSGLFLTQTVFHFLPPQAVICWKEYWFPINDTKGLVTATKKAALNILKKDNKLEVLLNSNEPLKNATLIVKAGKRELLNKVIAINPGVVYSEEIPFSKDDGKVSVILTSENGEKLLDYVEKQPIPEEELPKPGIYPEKIKPIIEMTAEEAYVEGINRLRFEEVQEAIDYFNHALKIDPGYSQAHNALGIIDYKWGKWDDAVSHFNASIKRHDDQGIPHYYLGLIYKRQEKFEDAIKELSIAAKKFDTDAVSHHFLGEINLAIGNLEKAIFHFNESLARNSRATKTENLLAVAYRIIGETNKALEINEKILKDDPSNFLSLWEKYNITKDEELLKRFRKYIRLDEHSYIELACDYAACGLYEEACKVLEDIVNVKGNDIFPMVYYYLGYFSKKAGKSNYAELYDKVKYCKSWDYVFPARIEAFTILNDVIKVHPDDLLAHFAIGNLYMSKYRADEAIEHWKKAVEIVEQLPKNDIKKRSEFITVIFRNIGCALYKLNNDYDKAFAWYERGLKYNPHHAQYYRELGEIAAAAGEVDKGIKYLEPAIKKVVKPSYVVRGLIPLYIKKGNDDRIIELIKSHHFDNWEGEYTVYNWYKDAHIRKGDKYIKQGKLKEAVKEYQEALVCPENVGSMAGVSYSKSLRGETKLLWKLANAYKKLKEDKLAYETLQKGIKNEPSEWALEGRYYYALCLRELGKQKEAIKVFDGIIEYANKTIMGSPNLTKSNLGHLNYWIGIAYAEKGLKDKAIEFLKESVANYQEAKAVDNPFYKEAKAKLAEFLK